MFSDFLASCSANKNFRIQEPDICLESIALTERTPVIAEDVDDKTNEALGGGGENDLRPRRTCILLQCRSRRSILRRLPEI